MSRAAQQLVSRIPSVYIASAYYPEPDMYAENLPLNYPQFDLRPRPDFYSNSSEII
jgi:hypothetical protein